MPHQFEGGWHRRKSKAEWTIQAWQQNAAKLINNTPKQFHVI